jgi:Tfp pilus assembly protein PilO
MELSELSLDAFSLVLLIVLIAFVAFNYMELKGILNQLTTLETDMRSLMSELRVVSSELQSLNVQAANIEERVDKRTHF